MTENEKILEDLKTTLCDMVEIIDFETERDKQDVKELDNDVSKIIDLLDELEEYRAIGTVEDIEKSMQNVSVLLAEHELLKLYQAIGTIEEFKVLKENSFFNFDSPLVRVDKKSYDKAIDEFAERLYSKIIAEIDDCADELEWIDEIAEQMKAGGK